MKNLTSYRKPSTLSTLLSLLISLTFIIVWLPFIRSTFDGDSYVWGTTFFGTQITGAGFGGDYYFVVLQLLFYSILFYSLFWIKDRRVYYVLLAAWYLLVFGNFLSEIAINGNQMFHGETMNVHISITWIIVPLSAIALILVAACIRADMKAEEVEISWNSKNKIWMLFVLGPIPIQAVLFSIGEPHGITDQIGVIMSIAQCFFVPVFLRPRTPNHKMVYA